MKISAQEFLYGISLGLIATGVCAFVAGLFFSQYPNLCTVGILIFLAGVAVQLLEAGYDIYSARSQKISKNQ